MAPLHDVHDALLFAFPSMFRLGCQLRSRDFTTLRVLLHEQTSTGAVLLVFSCFTLHFVILVLLHNRIKHYKPAVESDGSAVLHEKTKIREELCSRFFENKRVFLLQKRECLLQELEETIKKLRSIWELGNLRLLSYLTGIVSRQLLVNNACVSLVSYRHQFCICIYKKT